MLVNIVCIPWVMCMLATFQGLHFIINIAEINVTCNHLINKFKAYIPLRHNIFALGPCVGLDPQRQNFTFGDTNMLVSKNTKICVIPDSNLKFALPPTQNPNASQWNIGRVGYPTPTFRLGHVDFMLFIPFFSRWVPLFSVEYRL